MIKVDTDAMQSAEYRLHYIEAWLDKVEHELQDATRALRNCMDGGAVTDIMVMSLKQQARSLEKRRESVRQMSDVLQSVREQYEKCETDVKTDAETVSVFESISIGPIPKIYWLKTDDCQRVNAITEFETIDKYISPLITTGENAV